MLFHVSAARSHITALFTAVSVYAPRGRRSCHVTAGTRLSLHGTAERARATLRCAGCRLLPAIRQLFSRRYAEYDSADAVALCC